MKDSKHLYQEELDDFDKVILTLKDKALADDHPLVSALLLRIDFVVGLKAMIFDFQRFKLIRDIITKIDTSGGSTFETNPELVELLELIANDLINEFTRIYLHGDSEIQITNAYC